MPRSAGCCSAGLHTLIVDEFQDVDPVQREIACLLGDPESAPADTTRLMLVGDPKQSIYRFRGADVTVWRGVERDFRRTAVGQWSCRWKKISAASPRSSASSMRTVGPVLDSPIEGDTLQDFEVEYRSVRRRLPRPEGPGIARWRCS